MNFHKEESHFFTSKNSSVKVYTEWDLLEEVIVEMIDDIRIREWDSGLDAVIPKKSNKFLEKCGRIIPRRNNRISKKISKSTG